MSEPSIIQFKADAHRRLARSSGRWLFRVRVYLMALLTGILPAAYLLVLAGAAGLGLHHIHTMLMGVHFDSRFGWHDIQLIGFAVVEAIVAVLLVRQIITPEEPGDAFQEMLPADQPHFFELVRAVASKVGAPLPHRVVVDSSAGMRADTRNWVQVLFRKKPKLRLGLALPVGLTSLQLAGLLAHELAFFSRGTGAAAARFIRGVHRWFYLRIRHDPWMDWLNARAGRRGGSRIWWFWRALWCVVWLSLRPLRLLYSLCRAIGHGVMESSVKLADEAAAMLVGADVYASALERRAMIARVRLQEEWRISQKRGEVRLPDNIPLLVSRGLMVTDAEAEAHSMNQARTHWLDMAPKDSTRVTYASRWKHQGFLQVEGEATDLFRNFHEVARRVTYFHYQNDIGMAVNEHVLEAVEESVHKSRTSMETVEVLNRYFRGLAHPERAFCGIAEEQTALRNPDLLIVELIDCREWLDTYGERMASALGEWTCAWQLVRDLETGFLLARAGLQVQRGQFSLRDQSPEAFRQEIDRQRGVMDNMEGMLREYEGRLETRLACALELLWRGDAAKFPERLREVRETLPHWVLIYEALGLHLPVVREMMTHFNAFQSLGASVAGAVDSAAFITTVQAEIPRLARLVKDLLQNLTQWPYPFQTDFSAKPVTLAGYLAPQLESLKVLDFEGLKENGGSDRRMAAQHAARTLVQVVAPLMDRYLTLYHQAFAWITKAADMAEWHFVDPFNESLKVKDLQERHRSKRAIPDAPPPPPLPIDPELEYAAAAHH